MSGVHCVHSVLWRCGDDICSVGYDLRVGFVLKDNHGLKYRLFE